MTDLTEAVEAAGHDGDHECVSGRTWPRTADDPKRRVMFVEAEWRTLDEFWSSESAKAVMKDFAASAEAYADAVLGQKEGEE